MVLLKE